jgi:hypothetical protein
MTLSVLKGAGGTQPTRHTKKASMNMRGFIFASVR